MSTLSPVALQGSQRPRLASVPRGVTSSGPDASEFSAATGMFLDPWQQYSLDCLLQERADGKFAARTGVLVVPRQNGKGALDEAWELAQLFLYGAQIVVHTAHHNKTAKGAFAKMRAHITSSPVLKSRLMDDRSNGIRVANGEYGFTFKTGQQLIYGTRTGGLGRGWTIDALVLDEAQELSDEEYEALKPTVAAAPNPQTLLTGSAPKPHSEVLPRLMANGREGDSALCYLEWSIDEAVRNPDLDDRALWAQANPGYGIRLFDDAILDERATLSDEGFGRERLGIVQVSGVDQFATMWEALADPLSSITGAVTFAVEVAEDRSWSCIAAAGAGPDGLHVEHLDYRRGTGWVADRLHGLRARHGAARVVLRPNGPAGALLPDLAGVNVVKVSPQEYMQACGLFFDAVNDRELRHLGQPALDLSVSGAQRKRTAESWTWDSRNSGLDISPLVAVTLAAWGSRQKPARPGRLMVF